MSKEYNFKEIEEKWKDKWFSSDIYNAKEESSKLPKKYVLVEFPYPSGSGLHIGHAFSFTGGDVYARYMRMKGFNVLFPMGWDAFGLPTENYAIKMKRKPQEVTKENTDNFKKQMKNLGFSFDWSREVNTTDPDYYKWTQWIFVKLFEKGLAYKKEMPINWCPSCKIGLANEEVIEGKCERCGTETSRRNISQWVVKITDYADRLVEGLKDTDFIDKVKAAQINWIGKKEGLTIDFVVEGNDRKISCFTKYPETIFGVSWVVVSPEYPELDSLVATDQKKAVEEYVKQSRKKSELDRTNDSLEKTGVFTGSYVINPVNNKKVPIWVGDYVLANFGTGAVMGVAPHDNRDFMFAKKYGLEMLQVEVPVDDPNYVIDSYEKVIEDGLMVNSEQFNGMKARDEAYKAICDWMVEKGWAQRKIEYHLRDWIFSRQHYWGEPIPMVYCEKDGWVPVEEKDLPIKLPDVEHYEPTDTGESPLANMTDWVKTTCPKCGGEARRETDTMPNWAGSDWYFMRYVDPHNKEKIADFGKMKYWLPVDVYVGGDEHNTLHLLYSRFIYQFLYDLGVVPTPEPYYRRMSHGVILASDNHRMSKSKGNVLNPDEFATKVGSDSLRAYLMFMGPFDSTMAWNENALMGVKRFVNRIYKYVTDNIENFGDTDEQEVLSIVHKTIKKVSFGMENFQYNTAISKLMELLNYLDKIEPAKVSKKYIESIILMLAPVTPFIAEELWSELANKDSIHAQEWPKFDEKYLVEKNVSIPVQINSKMRGKIEVTEEDNEASVMEKIKADENIVKYLESKQPKKVVYVAMKILNIVV